VPLSEGGHDIERMAAAAAGAAVLWLPTPHNPTGRVIAPAQLEWLLERVPERCLVVVDEAYRAYADPELRPDAAALIARHGNVVVQRTFSKAYALAGLRVGYAIAPGPLAAALERIRPPVDVNAVAVASARAALADPGWADYVVHLVRRERARLETLLDELGWPYHPSQANFVTMLPPDPAGLLQALAGDGIALRDGRDLGLGGWLRASIGSPARMHVLRSALSRWSQEAT
jgi:histidinol-phosphate aminotransferase